jgi:hypothetical protein
MKRRLFAVLILCGAAIMFQRTFARSQQMATAELAHDSNSLPPLPPGKTTIMGGQIRKFDPVRDQFSLEVYGQRPMKILFDERTQVYRDGVRIPVRDLGPEDHASVQTTLDGDSVFAVSIHILSGSPEGECDGKVLKYDPSRGELTVASSMSPEQVNLIVSANSDITRVGEPDFTAGPSGLSDLVPGALISASFESGAAHRNAATRIRVLAVPGAAFVFTGNISFLDMHTGTMVIVDPRDGKSYQIRFDSARLPTSESLRPQANVTVTATYDGTQYAATAITRN